MRIPGLCSYAVGMLEDDQNCSRGRPSSGTRIRPSDNNIWSLQELPRTDVVMEIDYEQILWRRGNLFFVFVHSFIVWCGAFFRGKKKKFELIFSKLWISISYGRNRNGSFLSSVEMEIRGGMGFSLLHKHIFRLSGDSGLGAGSKQVRPRSLLVQPYSPLWQPQVTWL